MPDRPQARRPVESAHPVDGVSVDHGAAEPMSEDAVTGGDVERLSGYRGQAAGARRERRGALRYTDAEWAVIVQVAAVEGMRPGAWAQQAAFEAAVRVHRGERTDRATVEALLEELRQHRRVLTNVGGNLNDVARTANATGELPSLLAATTVLKLIRNVVLASDTLVSEVRSELLP